MTQFVLSLLVLFQAQAWAGPTEAVNSTVSKMLDILKSGSDRAKISGLCSLVRSDVDTATIGSELLGRNFGSIERDAAGIKRFKALVPSIIMDQFYELLQDKGGAEFSVNGTVPKGSSRVGVKIAIDGSNFVVTVLKSNNKVVDVEWNNFSLVNVKRDEFQRDLEIYWNRNNLTSLPVSDLVKDLENKGITKCGI